MTENAEKVKVTYDVIIWFLINNLSTDDHPLEYDNPDALLTLVREQHGTAKTITREALYNKTNKWG